MTRTKMVPPIDADLLSRVENLSDTAGYLTCLIEIVERELQELRQHARDRYRSTPELLAELGDWDEILTLLRLTGTQIDIVGDVANSVALAKLPVRI